MERGVYFDAWYPNNHCYHPSLPLRSMQMVDDLARYRATTLVWSCLGGGSISLPYLEHEAFDDVDPRLRIYGYMNDSEFIAECVKRGIKPFGIVFEVQGWEFPVRMNAAKDKIERINVLGGEQPDGWYGLREFTGDAYPDLFKKRFKDYFPDGLTNALGEQVTDIWEECASRRADGVAIHADWVEVRESGHSQQVYQMCRNNPVWRAYLKKIMEIQIRAGVPGIQLDECELPATSIYAGGCLCKDCVMQFRDYLVARRADGNLPAAYDGIDVSAFDLGAYMREHDLDRVYHTPFYREYWEFQREAIHKYFVELADYAKSYAKAYDGRELLLSGNFFNLGPLYFPIAPSVDILMTEMNNTLLRQGWWYRYCEAYANGKPIILAENPYGGIIPELVEQLDRGQGYDLYRLLLLEAAVYGCNMSVPYGGWMGSVIKNAFWPPRDATAEIQGFLADNERLFSGGSGAAVCVLYGYASYDWRDATGGGGKEIARDPRGILFAEPGRFHDPDAPRAPFWEDIKALSDARAVYDIKVLADGVFREDEFADADLASYKLLILPDLFALTSNQARVVERFARGGGRVLVQGRLDEEGGLAGRLRGLGSVTFVENPLERERALEALMAAFEPAYEAVWTARCSDALVGIHAHGGGSVCHLLNYHYDAEADHTPETAVELRVRGLFEAATQRLLDGGTRELPVRHEDGQTVVAIERLPLYCAVELR